MKNKYFRSAVAFVLAMIVACGVLTGCTGTKGKQPGNEKPQNSTTQQEQQKPDKEQKPEQNKPEQDKNNQSEVQPTEESALKILEKVWAAYGKEQKFAAMGGDAAAGITDNAGSFSLKDAAAVDSMLGVPEASVGKITEAASIIHMMNANNFTGAAFKTTDGATAKELAGEIEKHLSGRQWICGFPEKLYIATTDDGYVISAFGAGDIMKVFTEKLTGIYKVDVVVDKNLG